MVEQYSVLVNLEQKLSFLQSEADHLAMVHGEEHEEVRRLDQQAQEVKKEYGSVLLSTLLG